MNNRIYIIAEAGVNHNGDIETAKALVDAAAQAGADAVKFQTFSAEHLVCENAQKAAYQRKTTDASISQYQMLKKLELSKQMHIELIKYCRKKNIQFLSSPFDIESVRLLQELEVPIMKIPSGEITNLPYLRAVASTKKDVILSTGMSCLNEIKDAVRILKRNHAGDIVVLHCNTQYPTPMEDVNLRVMHTLKNEIQLPVGYSDHTEGIEVALAAAALGAVVIEKHVTLSRNMDGPDHKASIEPDELILMVKSIRNIEKALGSKIKKISPSEAENISVARKSIVAAQTIRKGDIFTESNLAVKRPGIGMSPMMWDEVIGTVSNKNYDVDELISI